MAGSDPVRVMLVDDEPDVRFLVEVILGDHPDVLLVASARSAEEALDALEGAAPDVALIDARMPLVSGFELVPQLLERAPRLRVAILTSIVDEVVERQAREAGAHACADKARFADLADLVRSLAAG